VKVYPLEAPKKENYDQPLPSVTARYHSATEPRPEGAVRLLGTRGFEPRSSASGT
jgi:hypothetical protein